MNTVYKMRQSLETQDADIALQWYDNVLRKNESGLINRFIDCEVELLDIKAEQRLQKEIADDHLRSELCIQIKRIDSYIWQRWINW